MACHAQVKRMHPCAVDSAGSSLPTVRGLSCSQTTCLSRQGPPSHPWNPNARRPETHNSVVLVQLYDTLAFTRDQILALRAIVLELGTQHHIYFTYHIASPLNSATQLSEHRADALERVPAEFRRIILPFDDSNILAIYPHVYEGLPEGKGLYYSGICLCRGSYSITRSTCGAGI